MIEKLVRVTRVGGRPLCCGLVVIDGVIVTTAPYFKRWRGGKFAEFEKYHGNSSGWKLEIVSRTRVCLDKR